MPSPLDSQPPDGGVVLDVDDVSFRRSGRAILDRLRFEALTGEVTALLGPNGAGKTTTIRCCTDLLTPDSGSIRISGRSPSEACAQGLVGVMPQDTGGWSAIRPLELLRYLASLYANPLPVDELARLLGIDDFAGTTYRRLSGGQQQLVNLAGSLIGRPRLLFLDEPTAGLDPHVRRRVWELIRQLRTDGVSVILTTHAMDEAQALADRVHIIDRGSIVLAGTMAELTADASLEDVFLAATDPERA